MVGCIALTNLRPKICVILLLNAFFLGTQFHPYFFNTVFFFFANESFVSLMGIILVFKASLSLNLRNKVRLVPLD